MTDHWYRRDRFEGWLQPISWGSDPQRDAKYERRQYLIERAAAAKRIHAQARKPWWRKIRWSFWK